MLAIFGIDLLGKPASHSPEEATRTIETLHRRYGRVIYELCMRYLGDRSEAEDAVQETFLSAYLGLEKFRYGDDHLNWLYRIGTNACLMMLRTRRRKGATPMDHIADSVDPASNQEQYLGARQLIEQLTDKLDERSLEIVAAHYIGGMSQGEVAEMLGVSRRAVVKRLTGVRKQFDDLWTKGGQHA